MALSVSCRPDVYKRQVDLDARVENITVGMQQRVEILKMLYRDNEILIFDEPTAVLTPQEIDELMATMKEFAKEGKSILFISHKLNEIMAVADRVTVPVSYTHLDVYKRQLCGRLQRGVPPPPSALAVRPPYSGFHL